MQITLNAKELTNCLEVVEKALPIRTTVPAINNILCHIAEKSITFSATNLQMFISAKMKYAGEDSKKILFPSKIVDIMRYLPTDSVTLNIDWHSYRIDITGGSAHFHLYGAEAEDYPTSFDDLLKQKGGHLIDKLVLKKLLKEVVFAASNEESRPAFNGVFFEFKEHYLSLTASDTYRLAVKKYNDQSLLFEDEKCLAPARAIRELLRILDDSSGIINMNLVNNNLLFSSNDIIFASRLLEEKYPDVSGVIPAEYKTRIHIDSKALENTIARATLLAEGKNQAVNLIVADNKLETRVSSQEGSMEDVVSVGQDGENVDLFINSRFVLDFFRIIDAEEVIIDFHGNGGPVVFRLPEDNLYLYLVLPIKKVS